METSTPGELPTELNKRVSKLIDLEDLMDIEDELEVFKFSRYELRRCIEPLLFKRRKLLKGSNQMETETVKHMAIDSDSNPENGNEDSLTRKLTEFLEWLFKSTGSEQCVDQNFVKKVANVDIGIQKDEKEIKLPRESLLQLRDLTEEIQNVLNSKIKPFVWNQIADNFLFQIEIYLQHNYFIRINADENYFVYFRLTFDCD